MMRLNDSVIIVMMVIIVMVITEMMLHHPVDSDHPGEEITTSCPASSIG